MLICTCPLLFHSPITPRTVTHNSYTDRILWKSSDGLGSNVTPLLYEPCPNFITSDHKPIRGAYLLKTNNRR